MSFRLKAEATKPPDNDNVAWLPHTMSRGVHTGQCRVASTPTVSRGFHTDSVAWLPPLGGRESAYRGADDGGTSPFRRI
jgi:hypothetical protein